MGTEANSAKLRAIVLAFGLPTRAIAKTCGVSRPYVARILSERDAFEGSTTFWSALERSLGRLVEARAAQVFEVPAQTVDLIKGLESSGGR